MWVGGAQVRGVQVPQKPGSTQAPAAHTAPSGLGGEAGSRQWVEPAVRSAMVRAINELGNDHLVRLCAPSTLVFPPSPCGSSGCR